MTLFVLVWLRLLFLNGANGTCIYSSEAKLRESICFCISAVSRLLFIPGNWKPKFLDLICYFDTVFLFWICQLVLN